MNKGFIKFVLLPLGLMGTLSCSGESIKNEPSDPFGDLPDASVELYSYSNQIRPSVHYTVEVAGGKATVIPTKEHQVCAFGCDGPVAVKVTYNADFIDKAEILPKSKDWRYVTSREAVTVVMSPGDKAVVEINGSEDCDLFLFANPLEAGKPSKEDPNVLYCEAGTVTDLKTLTLKSGQTLYIEGGAVVKSVLRALDAPDVTVKGCGILDARGIDARGIQFQRTDNLRIEDIVLLNDINWSTFISESDNVNISNYKVVAVENPNNKTGCENDALDILGCRNVTVKGCFGYAHDDVFCIKSQKWTYKGEVKNVLFEDCMAWNYLSGNSFVVGAETNENISGVTYRNCQSIHSAGRGTDNTLSRGGLSIHHCAGGHISDILFENIVLEDCKEYGIHLDIRKSYVKDLGTGVTYSPGTCDGVTLRNVTLLKKSPCGNVLMGYDSDHKITGVVFDNVVQEGVKFTKDNVKSFFTTWSNAECTVR